MILKVYISKRGQKPTNGDVIKAVFSEMPRQVCWSIETMMKAETDSDWWNAPYKRKLGGIDEQR